MPNLRNSKTNFKLLRIKRNAEFVRISKIGDKFHAQSLLLLTAPSEEFYSKDEKSGKNAQNFCRIGFTVSKKVGNAVQRNRAKRRLREAARKLFAEIGKDRFDYVIIAKHQINNADFAKIVSDLRFCLKRIHGAKREKSL